METNNTTFKMIQWSPYPRVLAHDHPCVSNTQPVYIDKYDRYIKIGKNVSLPKVIIPKNGTLIPGDHIPQQLVEKSDSTIAGPISLQNNSGLYVECNKIESADMGKLQQSVPKVRFDGDELLNLDFSLDEDLIEYLLPIWEISLIAGIGDSGKSLFYQQLSISIVRNTDEFLGLKIKSRHNSVLVVATEDNAKQIANRIRKQNKSIISEKASLKDLIILTSGENLIATLREELKAKKFDLIVLDALGDLMQEDSNSQTLVRQFFNELEKLIREFATTILIIHHLGKAPGRSERSKIIGSVAIVDRARNVLILEKDAYTGIRSLKIVKSNNLSEEKKNKPIKLKLDPESLTYSLASNSNAKKDIDTETPIVSEKVKKDQFWDNETPNQFRKNKNKPGRKFDNEKFLEAKKLHAKGMKLEEIGDIIGRNKSTISRWFRDHPAYDLSRDDVE